MKVATQSPQWKGKGATLIYITCNLYMVAATGQPNYIAGCCQLPSDLQFKVWKSLIWEPEDVLTVDYLKFGFLVGYQGPIPTPAEINHSSARRLLDDVVAYITKEVNEGAMLGVVQHYPSHPGARSMPS